MEKTDGATPITRKKFLTYGGRALAVAGLGKGVFNGVGGQLTLELPRIKVANLPPKFKGLTIGLLTDLHASPIVGASLLQSASRLLMSQKPDIIALTGDYISGATKFLSSDIGAFDPGQLSKLTTALNKLSAPLGIFGVLGNHDFWSGPKAVEAITSELERAIGVTWLRNRNETITLGGDQLHIAGVDDYWAPSYSLTKALEGLPEKGGRILLSHNPDVNENINHPHRVDLILSGHTHGGQVALPGIGMPFIPSPFGQKYREGLVKDGQRYTYVSRGVGALLAPIRFNCPPEVTVATLI